MTTWRRSLGAVLFALAAACTAAHAAGVQLQAVPVHYAPYAFLIGDWDTLSGNDANIHQSFRWGPGQSYIAYTTYTRPNGQTQESVHFDGIMVWNAGRRNLDFLFAIEPGSGGQEQGVVHAEADGSLIREVTLTDGKGAVHHFRQTFRQTGANAAVTSLRRQTPSGLWEPNFPGSDNLAMIRRPS